jgi:hypothetical protein
MLNRLLLVTRSLSHPAVARTALAARTGSDPVAAAALAFTAVPLAALMRLDFAGTDALCAGVTALRSAGRTRRIAIDALPKATASPIAAIFGSQTAVVLCHRYLAGAIEAEAPALAAMAGIDVEPSPLSPDARVPDLEPLSERLVWSQAQELDREHVPLIGGVWAQTVRSDEVAVLVPILRFLAGQLNAVAPAACAAVSATLTRALKRPVVVLHDPEAVDACFRILARRAVIVFIVIFWWLFLH